MGDEFGRGRNYYGRRENIGDQANVWTM